MLPTFGQGAAQSFEDAAVLASAFTLHKRDVAKALLHHERARHYRATRFQLAELRLSITCGPGTPLSRRRCSRRSTKRVSPAFAHDKRGGEDYFFWTNATTPARSASESLPAIRTGGTFR